MEPKYNVGDHVDTTISGQPFGPGVVSYVTPAEKLAVKLEDGSVEHHEQSYHVDVKHKGSYEFKESALTPAVTPAAQ